MYETKNNRFYPDPFTDDSIFTLAVFEKYEVVPKYNTLIQYELKFEENSNEYAVSCWAKDLEEVKSVAPLCGVDFDKIKTRQVWPPPPIDNKFFHPPWVITPKQAFDALKVLHPGLKQIKKDDMVHKIGASIQWEEGKTEYPEADICNLCDAKWLDNEWSVGCPSCDDNFKS